MKPIVITGNWDGQPIWREKTMGEILADEIDKDLARKNKYPNAFVSEKEQEILSDKHLK